MTLQGKMAKGSMWSLIEKGGQQLVSFFLFIVIARLIGPEEYGYAMLCIVILAFSKLLILGMAEGIVSLQLKDNESLSALFWVIMLTGSVLSALCYVNAETIAAAFGAPPIRALLQWFAPMPFLMGLMAVPHMIIMQKMEFKVYAIRSLVATIGSGIVGLTLALNGYGAQSIIVQQVALYLLNNVILWFYAEWRPSFIINIPNLKRSIKPGLNMMGADTLFFVEDQVPRVFLSNFSGPISTGYFAFAHRMRFALQEMLIVPALITLFPVLSQIKENKILQDEILENLFFLIGLVIFPIVILGTLTAPLYVPLLFGNKWIDAIPLLQLFLFLGLAAPFNAISNAIFRAYNKVSALVRLQCIFVSLFITTAYFTSQINLMAVGYSVFAVAVLRVPAFFFLIKLTTGIRIGPYIKAMYQSILSTVIMALAVCLSMNSLSVNILLGDLVITLVVGITVYVLVSMLMQRDRINVSLQQLKRLITQAKPAKKT